MKKIFLLFAAFCLAIAGNAQTKTYLGTDANHDGSVNISDVNYVISEMCGSGKSERVVSVDSVCALIRSIDANVAKQVEKKLIVSDDPSTPTTTDANLLPGKFSVSATKQVQFTKGNLYWDGSEFKFEAHQMDYPKVWDEKHVGNFYWSIHDEISYAEEYSDRFASIHNKFWCAEDNPLTVEGTSGLYVLSSEEWIYLLCGRNNSQNLFTFGATVIDEEMNYTTYLIIAPDDFTGVFPSDYTFSIDELNALNFVCLPGAGVRDGNEICTGYGNYWTATPDSEYEGIAYSMCSDPSFNIGGYWRGKGSSIRLVK